MCTDSQRRAFVVGAGEAWILLPNGTQVGYFVMPGVHLPNVTGEQGSLCAFDVNDTLWLVSEASIDFFTGSPQFTLQRLTSSGQLLNAGSFGINATITEAKAPIPTSIQFLFGGLGRLRLRPLHNSAYPVSALAQLYPFTFPRSTNSTHRWQW